MFRQRWPSQISFTLHRTFLTSRRALRRPSSLVSFLNRQIRRFQSSRGSNYEVFLREASAKTRLVWVCIGANTLVWLTWQAANAPTQDASRAAKFRQVGTDLRKNFLLSTQNFREGRYWVLLTSAFSHVRFVHLFVNLFTFQQLSKVLVYTPGLRATRHFGALIVGSALAGSFAFLSHENATAPHIQRVGLGFSAVVSGTVSAAACLMPHQRMLLFGIIPLPLWALAVGYIAYDTYAMDGDTSVAHDAHVGGSLFGVAFYMLAFRRFGGILGPRRLR